MPVFEVFLNKVHSIKDIFIIEIPVLSKSPF